MRALIVLVALLIPQYTIPGHTGANGGTLPAPVPTTKTCTNYDGGTGTSVTCTWSTSPAAGEFVAVGVWANGTGTLSVTDSASHTYTAVAPIYTPGFIASKTQLFYFGPLSGSITSVTVNDTISTGMLVNADTVTNIAASSPVDGTICHMDTGTTSTNMPCATPITTTFANDYIFCFALNSGGNLTPGSGFTAGSSFNSNNVTQYQVQAAIGATTPTISNSTSGQSATMSCAAFKP